MLILHILLFPRLERLRECLTNMVGGKEEKERERQRERERENRMTAREKNSLDGHNNSDPHCNYH